MWQKDTQYDNDHLCETRRTSPSAGTASLGVEDISLDIPRAASLRFSGRPGCGKSTTLRLLAGLELPDEGQILIDGKDVTTSAASDRNLSMVFQSYALFPASVGRRKRRVRPESPRVSQRRSARRSCTAPWRSPGFSATRIANPGELVRRPAPARCAWPGRSSRVSGCV